ncbi:MAG: hypothetical protein WCK36_02825 [Candidatus Firestonebacteria bacterium]
MPKRTKILVTVAALLFLAIIILQIRAGKEKAAPLPVKEVKIEASKSEK